MLDYCMRVITTVPSKVNLIENYKKQTVTCIEYNSSTYWTAYTDAWNLTYHNFIYRRLSEDKPPSSKHVEGIKNLKIHLENVHCFGLYCIITLQRTVQIP
jgi:formyltetrahydrofolate synthetase